MKHRFSFAVALLLSMTAWSQTSLFNNQGADIYMMPGSYMIVNNDSLFNYSGTIQNGGDLRVAGDIFNNGTLTGSPTTATGLYDIGGNWYNSGTVTSYQDSVSLNGGAQQIAGSAITPFYNLILAGTPSSVKLQQLDATVSGILDLRDHELATQQYVMTVLNTNTGAITEAAGGSGFVSSLGTGNLARATNSTSAYYYPTGTPSSITAYPSYFRPVNMTPAATSPDVYGVRLAQEPTADSFDVGYMDDSLCRVNPLYYHRMYHTQGADAVAIQMFFDPNDDGDWTDMAHWGTNGGNLWNYMGPSAAGSGYGFSSLQVSGWTDFSPHAFALAAKKFTVDAGQGQEVTEGVSVPLNATVSISSSSIDSIVWTPSANLSNDNTLDPTATPASTTTYTVKVTNTLHCSATDTITISVLPNGLLVPTAFTPNGDTRNDVLKPLNKNLEDIVFRVYNRWGEKIYETFDIGQGWDGTFKGQPQDLGVYVWMAEYKLTGMTSMTSVSGNVTLIK
jgi:gliding motility-associated-like protein